MYINVVQNKSNNKTSPGAILCTDRKLVILDYEDIMVSILALMLTLLSPVVHRINLHMGLNRCLTYIFIYIYMNFFLYLSDFF